MCALIGYLNYLSFLIEIEQLVTDFLGDKANRIKNGDTEISDCIGVLFVVDSCKLDLLNLFLELPVVDKGIFPFWDKLSLKLL